jgi:hypothetical protein
MEEAQPRSVFSPAAGFLSSGWNYVAGKSKADSLDVVMYRDEHGKLDFIVDNDILDCSIQVKETNF